MKKLIFIFLLFASLANAQSTLFRYDSTLVESSLINTGDCSYYSNSLRGVMVVTNTDSSIFTMTSDAYNTRPFLNESKEIYTLDSSRRILSQTFQYGDSLSWINNLKYTYTYDINGNIDSKTTSLWSNFNSSWMNNKLDSTVFSATGQTIRSAEYLWDTLSSTWYIQKSYDYSFNPNDQLLENTELNFLPTGSIRTGIRNINNYDVNGIPLSAYTLDYDTTYAYWKNESGQEYYYDAAGRDTMLLRLTGDSTSWVPNSKYVKIYNGSGLLIQLTNSSWMAGSWVDADRIFYEYNTQNLDSLETSQTFNGISWVNTGLLIQTYSPTNKLIERLSQSWDGTAWMNSSDSHFTYDIADSLTESLYANWDNGAWLDNSKRILIYYSYFPLSYYSADQFYSVNDGWQTIGESSISYDSTGHVLYTWFDGHTGMSGGSMSYSYYPDGKLRHAAGDGCTMGGLGSIVDRYYYHLMQADVQLNPSIACQGDSLLPVVNMTGDNNPSYFSWSPGFAVSDSTIGQPYLFPDLSSDYFLTVRDDSGSVSIRELIANHSAAAGLSIGPDTIICSGHSYTLDAGNQFQTYEWHDGSTQSSFIVNTNVSGIYNYWVLVQDSNQCINSDSVTITVDVCSGVVALNNSTLNYFPNPVNEQLCIQNSSLPSEYEISLFNAQGELVKYYFIGAENNCIVTTDLPAGIYYLQCIHENKILSGNKIIIIH